MNPRPGDPHGRSDLILGYGHDLVHEPVGEHGLEVAGSDRGRPHPVRIGRRRGSKRLAGSSFPAPVTAVRTQAPAPDAPHPGLPTPPVVAVPPPPPPPPPP